MDIFFQLLDDLGETCRGYAWGIAVYDFLIQGIKNAIKSKTSKTKHSEITIQGCIPLILVHYKYNTFLIIFFSMYYDYMVKTH